MVVELSKTYDFEGEKISSLDFSSSDKITAKDLMLAERTAAGGGRRVIKVPQIDTEVLMLLAVDITAKPIDFFRKLNLKDTNLVKQSVQAAFSEFETDKIKDLDFSGVEDLTAEDLMKAEQKASGNGRRLISFPQLDTEVLLFMAAKLTGRPAAFFEELNLSDTNIVKQNIQTAFLMQD